MPYKNLYNRTRCQARPVDGRKPGGSAKFSADARSLLGRELRLVQLGSMPGSFKPLKTVGSGVFEIRVRAGTAYRLIYIAKFEEAIYVLNAFEKRTQKAPKREIDLARKRLAEVIRQRQAEPR